MPACHQRTILLVEDEPILAMCEERTLAGFGYEVILASSGEQALKAVEGTPELDLILMDIDLGSGMDGTETAKLILNMRTLPIVFLTSHSEAGMVEKVRGITRYGYVIKNSGDFVLRSSIEMAFELFDTAHELRRSSEALKTHALGAERAEQGLRESEELFEDIFQTLSEGIACTTLSGQIVFINRSLERLFGLPREEIVGKTVRQIAQELLGAEELARFIPLLDRFGQGEAVLPLQVDLAGRSFQIDVCRNQETGRLTSIFRDVTERRRAELSLESEKDRLRNVLAGAGAGTWEWNIQTGEGSFDEASAALLGYPLKDLAPVSYDTWMRLKHLEDRGRAEALLREHVAGRTDHYSCETRMKHRNGSWVWIHARARITEHDSEGRPLRMFGTHIDITDRKRAEEVLQESEWRLSRAEKIARIGNWKLMLDTAQLVFSKGMQEIFGIDKDLVSFDEVRGLDLSEYHEALDKALLDLTTKGKPYDLEFKIRRASDGVIADIRTIASYDRASNIVLGVVQDISERRRAEADLLGNVARHRLAAERIESLLKEKDLILREVHHRIKNNMLSMKSLLHLQASKFEDPAVLSAFEDSETRLDSMMLLYERLYQSPNITEVSVKALLPPLVAQIVENHAHGRPVTITEKLEDVVVDAKRANALTIMINELVMNTLKHAFPEGGGGMIRLSASATSGHIVLGIGDDGVGMPEDIDFDSSPGFGLVLVRELAKQHGAALRLERGKGTRVVIEFEKQVDGAQPHLVLATPPNLY